MTLAFSWISSEVCVWILGGGNSTILGAVSPSPKHAWRPGSVKPWQNIPTAGTPAFSAAAMHRETAGAQVPQQPMVTMSASTPDS